ncbi:hypothetical protein [Micromonospora tarensis]|uniref:Helix-turn-helix domain-containing protein n=1 Tax=Micromonospora tarensis TaxID=2806100 RepID=A0ABS1YCE7_9ACTN|nr:hypothetical protein [Micromonospora tarensis]MBM0275076.1 hypothetical protein [Micromonospora tarensis]
MSGSVWISPAEAAELLEISARTVQRSLQDEDQRLREWGAEGTGWRYKPLSTRGAYQLRRSAVMAKAGEPEQ